VDLLRVIKGRARISLIVFTVAEANVSFVIVDRQKALREVARYNTVWAVSQAVGEFYRFEERVAAYGTPGTGIDKTRCSSASTSSATASTFFATVRSRSSPMRNPSRARPSRPLADCDRDRSPCADDRAPGTTLRILELAKPFEGKLGRLAATANEYGGDQTSVDQQRLLQLHWMFSAFAVALVVCGLAFIVLLFVQNRLLMKAYETLRTLADELRAAKDTADAASEANRGSSRRSATSCARRSMP